MPGAPTPQELLEPIAADAGPTFITAPMPEAPTGTLAASIEGGFPPLTMTDELAGGKPPLGQDMNGFFFLVSSHTFYQQCGQAYRYSGTLAAAIGGYLAGSILGMSDGAGLWLNIVDGNTTDPDAGGLGWFPLASGGVGTQAGLTGGTVDLPIAIAKFNVIVLRGILTSNLTIRLPSNVPNVASKEWLIINATSGAFTTSVISTAVGSAGVIVPQGGFSSPMGVYSVGDGNVYPTVAPLGVPIDQNPTPLTLAQRTNNGDILARFFNSSGPVLNNTIVNIIADAGDGFLGKNSLTNFESQCLLQGFGGQLVNGQVPFSVISQWASTLFASPSFTGIPTAPTAAAGTTSTQVATTAFANPGVVVNANGICITLPSGYKLQAGSCNPNGGSVLVTFPVPFTSSVFPIAQSQAGGSVGTWFPTGSVNLNNMRVANTGGTAFWFAIGI